MDREKKKNIPKVLVDLRMQHYTDKRNLKIQQIKEVIIILFIWFIYILGKIIVNLRARKWKQAGNKFSTKLSN